MEPVIGTLKEKMALRRELLRILRAMPVEERLASDEAIRQRLVSMPAYRQAKRLFFYVGTGWEEDTRPLIEEALAAGKQVAVPRCLPLSQAAPLPAGEGSSAMASLAASAENKGAISPAGEAPGSDTKAVGSSSEASGSSTAQIRLGIMEACLIQGLDELRQVPPLGLWEPAESAPVIEPASLGFAVIPCIACDRSGLRLGQGGGYYDRFLAGQDFVKAALCRQDMLRDWLPGDAHDQRVGFIVTDLDVYTAEIG